MSEVIYFICEFLCSGQWKQASEMAVKIANTIEYVDVILPEF